MKTTIYSFAIRSFVFFCCLSSFAGAAVTEQILTDVPSVFEQLVPSKDMPLIPSSQDTTFNPIFKIFYAAIKNLKGLNYYTATGLVLPLPGTDQEVVFHWGFKGSGHILKPLPTINATVRSALTQRLQKNNPSTMKELGYAVLQNELLKYSKNTPALKWLTQANLNPLTLFGLKLILLVKTTVDSSQTRSSFQAEFMRLLFRLSLTEDFKLLDAQQPLSSFIPTELKNIINLQVPGCIEFIDDLWAQRATPKVDEKAAYYSMSCFVFRDKEFAEKIHHKMSAYQGTEFTNYTTQLVNLNQHQVVDFENFTKFPKSQALVGFLHTTHTNTQQLPASVSQAITTATTFPTIKLVSAENGEQWLCFATNTLGAVDTIKEIMLSLTQALRKYIAYKKELLTRKDTDALAYQQQQEQQEHAAEVVQNFIATEEGAASFDRLTQEITSITQPENIQTTVVQKLTTLKNELTAKLQDLEKQKDALTTDLERWEILKNITKGKDNAKIQATIKNEQKKLAEITNSIEQTRDEITKLSTDLTPMSQIERDHKNLAMLLALVEQQQNQGLTPSDKLLSAIELLQNKIKNSTHSSQEIDIDLRLSRRTQVAQALTSEAATIEKQLQEKLAQFSQITDEDQRTIQELLFGQQQEGYTTYIQQLKAEAQRITEQNQKALELKRYKKALAIVDLAQTSQEQGKKIRDLEAQVGYLFTTQQEENFLENIRITHPEIKEFFVDLNSDQEGFVAIKDTLVNALSEVLKHSEHVQNNPILFQYGINMVKAFVPNLFPLLASLTTNAA